MALYASLALAQEVGVRGKVTDAAGNPMEGAFVRILNTNLGTVTDREGFFSLPVKPGKYTVYVTALGYSGRERTLDVTTPGADASTIVLEEEAVALDDVVVTAQKEEEDLQRVPFSISALTARKVNEYRIWNSKDIAGIAPNLYSANPGDNRNVTAVRGIGTTSYDPAVATYIDGVNQFGLDTYIAPLFDVERIEVLRGPQGTLYGRNAMGGVINIITRRPTNVTSGFAEASVGNYGQQRYSAGVRTPLVQNKLFLGVAGMYDRMDGFYTNVYNNTDYDKKHSLTGNYYLTWVVNPAWSVTANVKHHAARNHGAFTLAGSPDAAFENPFDVNQNASTELVDNTFNSSLTINHTGSAFNFTSLSTYQSNYRYYKTPIDGDFSPLDIVSIENNYGRDWNRVQVYTQEFKFSSPTSSTSPLKWTAGTYLYYQDNPVNQTTLYGENADVYGLPPGASLVNKATGENKGIAFYGQATYSIHPQVDVTAGLRYDYEDRKQGVVGAFNFPGMGAIPTDTASSVSYSAFSPKVGATYHLNERHHAYAVYSRGFRTGGLTQYSGDPTAPPMVSYKPEYSNNFEIGVKNSFLENRVNVNFSAFYVKVTDAQIPTLILPEAITITRNAGELTSKGVELEITAAPVAGLQVDYSLGVTDATYDVLELPVQQEDGSKITVNYKGNKQLYTPAVTSMLAVQYSYPVASWQSLRAVVRGEWFYFGETYYDLANNIRQHPYAILNARAGFAGRSFEVMFWMRNIGDKRYISYAYDFGATRLGDPQNLGVTVRKSF